jgi:hypothetical protein
MLKSLMFLLHEVLQDLGDRCGIESTDRDFKEIAARVDHEGKSFLTISLPTLAKALERGLDEGKVGHTSFPGFQLRGSTPLLLGGFFDQVIDRETGDLLPCPSVEAIRAIRQVSLMFGKVLLRTSEKRNRKALRKYIEVDAAIPLYDSMLTGTPLWEEYQSMGRRLWSSVYATVDGNIYSGKILPKHGPGATADRLKGNQKYDQQEWTERLESIFPFGMYATPSWKETVSTPCDCSHGCSCSPSTVVEWHEPGSERPVRVITVPKTAKTPRIIAIEPTCMQFMQQAILEDLVKALEEDDISSWLIGIGDQIPNQDMALQGSLDGSLATLDLSEASDRVSVMHVRALLANHPNLREGVEATRSLKASVLVDKEAVTVTLNKFASMGSALCFPFEAMVFATIVFTAIEKELGHRLTRRDIKSFKGQVRVYGDDIIVPARFAHCVTASLEAFGLKVNADKSFWTGRFRESCGKEYYDGSDVCIVRVRRVLPTSRKDVPGVVSAVSLRNQLFLAGYVKAVEYLDTLIERIIPFPEVQPTSPVLGKFTYGPFEVHKWDSSLQRPLVRGAVLKSTLPKSHLEGDGALLKFFLKRGDEPVFDRKHLERSGRPVSVRIVTRLAPPY